MKSRFVQKLSLLLALTIAAASVSGCSESAVEEAQSGGTEKEEQVTHADDPVPAGETADQPTDSLEARQLVDDGLAERDFGGETFRMLCQTSYANFQYAEELTGDTLTDAVYNRNVKVEDRFNVKLAFDDDEGGALANRIMNSTLAGEDDCDLYIGHSIYSGKVATEGIFRNWYDLDVDFTKPWYPQFAVEHLTLNGRMFLTVSDICLSVAGNTYCYYFNKEAAQSAQFEDPYTVVKEGRWTVDKLMNEIAAYYIDADGDGSKGSRDIYGFAGEKLNSLCAYLYSFEIDVLDVKEDGSFEILLGNSERSVDAFEKLRKLLYQTDGSYYGGPNEAWNGDLFASGNALFITGLLRNSATTYRDTCDFDYGIIPYPKYEESQERYYTVAGGSFASCAVPVTSTRDELTSVLFAALSAETWKNVQPLYYDVVLKFKGARDETSIEMIDIILDGRNIDFAFVYDAFSGFMYKIKDILISNMGVVTYVAKGRRVFASHYENVMKLFFED